MCLLFDFVRPELYVRGFQQHYLDALGWQWDDSLQAGLVSLCVSSLFSVIGVLTAAAGCRTHPHPATRLMLITSTVEALYGRNGVSSDVFLSERYWERFKSSKEAALDMVPYRGEWHAAGVGLGAYMEQRWDEFHALLPQLEAEKGHWRRFSYLQETPRFPSPS